MKVILTEKITKLGNIGDAVEVKTGYARNYLLPNNKAMRYTRENVALFEAKKAEIIARHENAKKKAESMVDSVKNAKLHMIRQAGDTGQLYGSVTIRDIAGAIKDAGFDVARRYVYMEKPIKDLGIYQIKLNLHPEVSQTILVNVARTSEEAKKQAKAYNQE